MKNDFFVQRIILTEDNRTAATVELQPGKTGTLVTITKDDDYESFHLVRALLIAAHELCESPNFQRNLKRAIEEMDRVLEEEHFESLKALAALLTKQEPPAADVGVDLPF